MPRRLYAYLAYAGAAPFVACALLPLAGSEAIAPFGQLDALASSYALAIISFLSGVHWATHLYAQRQTPLNLFVVSNVVLLLVWFVYVIAPLGWQLLSQILALLFLLLVDWRLRQQAFIDSHYFNVRLVATLLAGGSLLLIMLTR